jgi:hypothetical protein
MMTSRILVRADRSVLPKVGTKDARTQHAILDPTVKSALCVGVNLYNASSFFPTDRSHEQSYGVGVDATPSANMDGCVETIDRAASA